MIKSLCENWEFRPVGQSEWKNATVPGCNFLDLMDNGDIPDPFIGLNENEVEWVGKTDFEYRSFFELTADELEADEILLVAKQLDTICDVTINSRPAFSCNNCFVEQTFDIKPLAVEGKNEISIYFHSPVNYVKAKYKDCSTPVNSNGQNGIVHIRKPQCHFGWDWGPVLPLSGVTDDIYLKFV